MNPIPTVFIVDDDSAVRRGLNRLVRSAGYQVATFASAGEFLDHVEGDGPGCLVLDMQLPDRSGLDLQQSLAGRGRLLPIVFLTGKEYRKRSGSGVVYDDPRVGVGPNVLS